MESSNDWNDAERRVERAARLFEQRKLDEALEELQIAVEINPFNAGWLSNLAITLDELGRYDEAIGAYQQALEIDPADVSTRHRLGVIFQRAGRHREAIEAFDQIEKAQSDYEPAYCHRIASYAELGEHESAEEMFYLGRLVKEHCAACYFNIGCSLAARQLWERAIFCWRRTLDIQPTHSQAHLRLADAHWQRGELDRARRHFAARLRQAPRDYAALCDFSCLLIEMGRIEEAGERLGTIAAAVANNNAGVQFARGLWHLAQRRLGEAAEGFARTLQLDPTFPRAHLYLGQIHLSMGQSIEAKTHLRSELVLRPDDLGTLRDLANLLIDTGETRSAITCLRRLVSLDPNDVSAWQNLGVAHFLRSQHDAGISACKRALAVAPWHIPSTHNLATALGELGRFDEALSILNQTTGDDFADLRLRLRVLRARARIKAFFAGLFRRNR